MGADLFRIAISREVDRSRYLRAMLSTQHQSFKRNVPRCLRPNDTPVPTPGEAPAGVSGHHPRQ